MSNGIFVFYIFLLNKEKFEFQHLFSSTLSLPSICRIRKFNIICLLYLYLLLIASYVISFISIKIIWAILNINFISVAILCHACFLLECEIERGVYYRTHLHALHPNRNKYISSWYDKSCVIYAGSFKTWFKIWKYEYWQNKILGDGKFPCF